MTNNVSIESDAQVIHSLLSPPVTVVNQAHIQDSILMPGVRVGRGARLCRAIVDENVTIPEGAQISFDLNRDRGIGLVTDSGIVVIPANARWRDVQDCPVRVERTVAAIESSEESRRSANFRVFRVGHD